MLNNPGQKYWEAPVTLSVSAQQYQSPTEITDPYGNNELDLTIYVSCYNEEAFIVTTLDTIIKAMEITKKSYEIIVIDDGSKDSSIELVKNYIQQHPDINIIHRVNPQNKGLAQNYVDGAFIGKGKYYRLICGDNAEPLETMVDVFNMIGKADIIIPYYVSAQGKSATRQWISKTFTHIINLASGNNIHYYKGLQIHLRHNVMRWAPHTRGFGFQAGLLCSLLNLGFTYKQIPCITIERRGGRGSAVTWKNLGSVIHIFLSVVMRRIRPLH